MTVALNLQKVKQLQWYMSHHEGGAVGFGIGGSVGAGGAMRCEQSTIGAMPESRVAVGRDVYFFTINCVERRERERERERERARERESERD